MKFILFCLIIVLTAEAGSWDSYIDNLIGHSAGNTDKACIIGKSGSKWTTDQHPNALRLTAHEVQSIAKCFREKDYTPFMAEGVLAEGEKYRFLRGDGNVVLAKKQGSGALTLQASGTAIVIGHTAEGKSQGNTNKAVGVIAGYLESLGM